MELETVPPDNPLRSKAIDLLLSLKTTLEINQNTDEEDRELLMNLSPIYLEKLAEAEQKGRQKGRQEIQRSVIENLLQVRFGSLDKELNGIIEPLLALSPEEFTPLLVQLSREELLNRFYQQ
jgi:hypothetical protein